MRLIIILLMSVALLSCASQPVNNSGTDNSSVTENVEAAKINTQLGANYIAKGEYELANDKLERAIKQDPRSPTARWTYAMLQEQLKQTNVAETHYKKALQIDSKDSKAQNAYASFLCRQGRYQEADKHFKQALLDPLLRGREAINLTAGVCAMEIPNYSAAESYFNQVVEVQPKNRVALYQLSKASFLQNNLPAAQSYLHDFENASPHTPQSLWLAYRVERQLGNVRIAQSYAKLLTSQFPTSKEAEKLARVN